MHSYVAVTGSFWTLEDTLLGYMFNDLIWCGQQEREREVPPKDGTITTFIDDRWTENM